MSIEANLPPQATGYLLLFRNPNWIRDDMSADELHQVLEKVKAWFEQLSASGKLVSAQPLLEESVVISGKNGRSATDGPFSEAKEVIAGYVLLSAESMEEAVAIARMNPAHDYGMVTEVRPTANNCPHTYRALNRLATTTP